MPDISLLKTTRISERIPGANIAQGGATARAIAGLGGELENFAFNLQKKREKAENDTFLINSNIAYEREMNAKSEELKKQYGRDFGGLNTALQEEGNAMREKYLESAPTTEAKQMFNLESTKILGDHQLKTDQYAQQLKLADAHDAKEELAKYRGNQFLENPLDLERDVKYKAAIEDIRDPNLFTPEEMDKATEKARKIMRQGVLDGFLSQGSKLGVDGKIHKEREYFKKGLEFLNSNNEMLAGMSPNERLEYETKFEVASRQSRERDTNHTRQQVSMFINSGAQDEGLALSLAQKVAAAPNFDKFEREALTSQLMESTAYQKFDRASGLVPFQERDTGKFVDNFVNSLGVKDPVVVASTKASLEKSIAAKTSIDERDMKSDVAGYFYKRDANIQNLSKMAVAGNRQAFHDLSMELDSHYDRFKVPRAARMYTTPNMRQQLKTTFNNSLHNRDYPTALKVLEDVESMGPQKAYSTLKEIGVEEKYAVVGELPDPAVRLRMLRNLNELSENKKRANDLGIEKSDLDKTRESLSKSDFIMAVNQMGGGYGKTKAAAYMDLMEADKLGRVATSGKDIDDEVLLSTFKDGYQDLKVGRHRILYPGNAIKPAQMESFLNYYSSDKTNFTKNLDLSLDEDISEESMNTSLAENGKWMTSLDKKGLELWAKNGQGILGPVMQNTKNGKDHVFFSWEDINRFRAPGKESINTESLRQQFRDIWRGK